MNEPKATGYVRVIQRATGPVYYAHIRTPDGRRLQRKLGPAWERRSGIGLSGDAQLRPCGGRWGRDHPMDCGGWSGLGQAPL